MNRRNTLTTAVFLVSLLVVILLHVSLIIRSRDLYDSLSALSGRIENYYESIPAGEHSVSSSVQNKYPGDDGDWLIWAFRVEPKTLNQISVDSDIYSRWITTPYIFEPLLDYDDDTLELIPYLAESYDVSKDGLSVTFNLRDDIFFSDGIRVTSDDVIFTYETMMNPYIDAANLAQMFVDVDRVEKISDKSVRFYMKRPFFKTLDNLSFIDVGVYPKHIYQFTDPNDFNKRVSNPVGSGPYIFEKWTVGSEIVLRRNENYWGKKPNFHKVIYKFITNSIAAVQALRAGEVDILIPEPEQFADLGQDDEFLKKFYHFEIYEPRIPFFYIGWNIDTPYFSDPRVRLAMTHIVDRRRIITHLLKGAGRITTGPFYSGGRESDPSIEPWPYDPERARRLLDDAGWTDTDDDGIREKNGRKFAFKFMYSSSNTFYTRLAKLLKDQAAGVGIDLVPDPYEWSVLIPRLSDRKFEAMVMGWGGDMVQDPYQIWHSSQIENRGSNYVGFHNEKADELMELARKTLDTEKRNEIYHHLHRILHELQPYTFLFERPEMILLDRRFENVRVHAKGLNWLEWYVPKEKQKY